MPFSRAWFLALRATPRALGVTSDKLHAHCQREKGCGPRAIIHERLLREACTRLAQLDLPLRFFRKYRGASPGSYRWQIRLEHARSGPSYGVWP